MFSSQIADAVHKEIEKKKRKRKKPLFFIPAKN
jgi:hypothetical protein